MSEQSAAGQRVVTAAAPDAWAAYRSAVLAVGLGGIAGALARWKLAEWVAERWSTEFPWGTLIINLTGSFLIGLYLRYIAEHDGKRPFSRLLIATGVMGAYTTFSAFAYETVRLVQHGHIVLAVAYVSASLCLGLAVTQGGTEVARRVRKL